MVNGNTPSPLPNASTSQEENTMLQLIEDGPVKNIEQLFVDILTVPYDLRQRIFYWPEEREFCEHVSSVGKALDMLTAVHRTFLGQFKILSNLRATFIQSPTEFFVVSMYFCDRALDSLLRSTRKVQNDISELFKNLAQLESECSWRYRWTKKSFLEDKYPKDAAARKESITRPDMEIKEQRVLLLAELCERIGIVRRGGSNMFSLLGRRWLSEYAHDTASRKPNDVIMVTGRVNNTRQGNPSIDKGNGSAEPEVGSSDLPPIPIAQYTAGIRSRLAQNRENPVEVPETPEVQRAGGVVKTQRSSQRNRKASQSSGRSELTDSDKHVQLVTRNLMGDGSADLLDSPAQKSGVSIEAIRAVSQKDLFVRAVGDPVEDHDLQHRNQAQSGLPQVTSNKLKSRKEPSSNARVALHNQVQDHEKQDEGRAYSPSV